MTVPAALTAREVPVEIVGLDGRAALPDLPVTALCSW